MVAKILTLLSMLAQFAQFLMRRAEKEEARNEGKQEFSHAALQEENSIRKQWEEIDTSPSLDDDMLAWLRGEDHRTASDRLSSISGAAGARERDTAQRGV